MRVHADDLLTVLAALQAPNRSSGQPFAERVTSLQI